MIRAFHHLMNLTGKRKMKRQRWWWETVLCLLPFCPSATQSTLNKHGPKPSVMILSSASKEASKEDPLYWASVLSRILGTFMINFTFDFIRMQGVLFKWKCGVAVDCCRAPKVNISLLKSTLCGLDAFPSPCTVIMKAWVAGFCSRLEKIKYHFRVCW